METALTAPTPEPESDAAPAVEAIPEIPALSGHDLCEICKRGGSEAVQAYVRVQLKEHGTLDFCGHHFAEKEIDFAAAGYTWRDERHRLLPDPIAKPEGYQVAGIQGYGYTAG